jgi:hypothetical protein
MRIESDPEVLPEAELRAAYRGTRGNYIPEWQVMPLLFGGRDREWFMGI